MNMSPKDANELTKDNTIIDFYGDIDKAVEFFNYLHSKLGNSARLIIDCTYNTVGVAHTYIT